jgi:hypothetical protein
MSSSSNNFDPETFDIFLREKKERKTFQELQIIKARQCGGLSAKKSQSSSDEESKFE